MKPDTPAGSAATATATATTMATTTATTAAAAPSEPVLEVLSPWRESWRVFRSNQAALVGLMLLGALLLTMALGPNWYGVAPMDIMAAPFTPPFVDSQVWLGTDRSEEHTSELQSQ